MGVVLNRREAIKAAGLSVAAGALAASGEVVRPGDRRRVLRAAHLTDTHIQPERSADQGVRACLRHVQAMSDQSDLILTGGDHVMDAFERDEARTRLQWELWAKVLKGECSLPVEPCLGNHDIWGWNKAKSKASGDEARYGKKWALEALGLAREYRSFDRAGWHFAVLDSISSDGKDGYVADLGEEQRAWLDADLAGVPPGVPVLVLSHVPIASICAWYFGGKPEEKRKWECPGGLMHVDARAIQAIFKRHGNVRVCVSGHIHLVDRVEYDGVTYLCDGAVSGNWWKGRFHECGPGYALLDLFDDGSFEREYVEYGWEARA